MAGIFINYRREDSKGFAVALQQKLEYYYGADQVFMDVGSIKAGANFANEIAKSMRSSNVCLVLIGRDWLRASDANGPRLLQPSDWVRIEIETALRRRMSVIPILLDGATAPRKSDLPASLQGLADLQMVQLSHARFGAEAEELAEEFSHVLKPRRPFATAQPAASAVEASGWQVTLTKRKRYWFSLSIMAGDRVHDVVVSSWTNSLTLDGNKFDTRKVHPFSLRWYAEFTLAGSKLRLTWEERLMAIKVIELTADKKVIFAVV